MQIQLGPNPKDLFGDSQMSLRLFSLAVLPALFLFCTGFATAATDLESAKRAYHDKDYPSAVTQFSLLADQGNAEAQLILGKMYMMGQGVPKDPELCEKWLRASATQGNADAEFFLGAMYLLPKRDIAQGVKWLQLSAEQGMQDAQYLLGKAYVTGDNAIPRDAVQADMWLRLAAKGNKQFYQDELNGAERKMTSDEITKGKELAAAWKPKSTASANVQAAK
jgi:TPR repeat protein